MSKLYSLNDFVYQVLFVVIFFIPTPASSVLCHPTSERNFLMHLSSPLGGELNFVFPECSSDGPECPVADPAEQHGE